ncbi:MAG: hypothetical protein ACREMG_05150, partial [Gemmatimonadales bacterium]
MRRTLGALTLAVPLLFAATITSPPAALAQGAALDDATIVAIFDGANTADIETGKLAAKRGTSQQVRDFGA